MVQTYEDWVSTHDLTNWIVDPETQLEPGDVIESWSAAFGAEKHKVQAIDLGVIHTHIGWRFHVSDTVCYKVVTSNTSENVQIVPLGSGVKCSCGAAHTSNPTHHLHYCDLCDKM